MHMENRVGRFPNQFIRNGANSSGKGLAHLQNTEKKVNNWYRGLALLPTHLEKRHLIL